MQRKIEQLVSGQARKLASPEHPLHFLLYSSNKHLQEDSKYVDLQVGKQVWYNVPRRMRQELWLSVLHKHKGAGAIAAKQYATLVRQALPVDVDADIEKDVGRTFPNAARFATEAGKLSLLRVLRAYAVYDPEVGYCQGMNFLAGLLLTWMPNEATAFGGLVVLMQQRMLRDLYKSDLAKLQVYLWQFSKLLPARLGRHMDGHGVLPVLYLSSWLLTSFGSDFPLFFSSRVLDVVLTGSYPHAVLKVAMTLLKHCGKKLLALDDMEEIVHYLKAEMPNWSREVLQDVLSDALSQAWTPAQEAILSSEAGMESVIDAVGRVNAAAQDNLAELAEAAQQAEQAQLSNTPINMSSGLATPPRHSSQNQQPAGSSSNAASPLPPLPGKTPLASVRSASWTARLRALPTSPSLPLPASPVSHPPNRRHTTEEAAHPSSSDADNGRQHSADVQPHAESRSASSTPGRLTTPEDTVQSPEGSQAVELPDSRPASATAMAASPVEVDLLSFHPDTDAEDGIISQASKAQQPSSSLLHSAGSISGSQAHQLTGTTNGLAEPMSSAHDVHLQTSLLGSQQLPETLGHVWSDAGQHQLPDDPFRLTADTSHELAQSSRHLSGMSTLGESRGSDLESWGSFLLPDESSNMMADSMQSSRSQTDTLLHTLSSTSMSEGPASALPLSLIGVVSGHMSMPEDLSPNACITSQQRVQLDLFLQSSSSVK